MNSFMYDLIDITTNKITGVKLYSFWKTKNKKIILLV